MPDGEALAQAAAREREVADLRRRLAEEAAQHRAALSARQQGWSSEKEHLTDHALGADASQELRDLERQRDFLHMQVQMQQQQPQAPAAAPLEACNTVPYAARLLLGLGGQPSAPGDACAERGSEAALAQRLAQSARELAAERRMVDEERRALVARMDAGEAEWLVEHEEASGQGLEPSARAPMVAQGGDDGQGAAAARAALLSESAALLDRLRELAPLPQPPPVTGSCAAPHSIAESADEVRLLVELPGVRPAELAIEVDDCAAEVQVGARVRVHGTRKVPPVAIAPAGYEARPGGTISHGAVDLTLDVAGRFTDPGAPVVSYEQGLLQLVWKKKGVCRRQLRVQQVQR
eukprot:TRINITY_DN28481_c0_g1_i1.p1 TRINITY_DN28481_c0_g1~~TRINITY_DN28481_c0_g1_i1.p1  ORF type:complete len:350 (+),score=91.29 TRINITY_DN28481_c0_g1_i1:61-1110(+)